MNNIKNILELEQFQAIELAKELGEIDPEIHLRLQDIILRTGVSYVEALEYVVTVNVILWAKVYLNWDARDYQEEMLNQGVKSRKLVLRLGRRLGKTEVMCILILWFAYTQRNKVSATQYDILIIGPYETQVDLIFARLTQLIESSPILADCVTKSVEHKIELSNGAVIQGKTAGASSGGSQKAGAGTRGMRGDLLIIDEADYVGSAQITNIMNIINDNPDTAKLLVASTPSGKREEFYKWCMGATRTYRVTDEDIKEYKFSGYVLDKNDRGNGWTQIFAPSVVNSKLLMINPDTKRSYLEDLRFELSEMRFVQEVMAEFGEEDFGIYQKRFIDQALKEGIRINHQYMNNCTKEEVLRYKQARRYNKWMLGVKSDKFTRQIA